MPFKSPLAAFLTAALISSTVVLRAALKLKSTKETLMVGTRIANPSNFPFNSGSTRPTAAAAPVLVGIIDMVAERARRRSEWYTSVNTWSLVYEWMVVMTPARMPISSCSTFARGARQFVVQDAFEMTLKLDFKILWFTP